RAFFEPYQIRIDQLPGEVDFEKDGVPRAFDCHLDSPTFLFVRGDDKNPVKDQPLSPGVPRLLALGELDIQPVKLSATAQTPGLRPFVLENYLRAAEKRIAGARSELEKARKDLSEIERTVQKEAAKPVPPAAEEAKPIIQETFAAARPE